jgi:predicted component of type VI protein secretion system
MSLTKEVIIDKIEVLESGSIQVRQATRVLEDGEVLSTSYHRHVLEKDADLTNEDPKVVAIATAAWS